MNASAASAEPDAALRARLAARIRDVPDFPAPGVLFKDITPLLADATTFGACIDALAAPWRSARLDAVCGIEARGFIFGAALARALDVGFAPLRKAGKLPAATRAIEYQLEYGAAQLEIHADAVAPGARVVLVDDVLASGGTLVASRELLRSVGAEIAGAAVLIELAGLRGRARWPSEIPLLALLRY